MHDARPETVNADTSSPKKDFGFQPKLTHLITKLSTQEVKK